jgi:hypothetical protein
MIKVLLVAVAVFAAALILVSTWRGPGVGGDATVYLTTANNLLHGAGLGMLNPDGTFSYLSYYPPLFPLSLSALGLTGIDLPAAARWLNAVLFGLMAWLTGYTLGRATPSQMIGVLAAAVLALSPAAIPQFSWAMSEPLANFLGFLGLACLLWNLEGDGRFGGLALSAVLCGDSIITRYASLPFLAAGALGIILLAEGRFWRKVGRAAAYTGIGLIPLVVWEAWDYSRSSSLASRTLGGGLGLREALTSFWAGLRNVILGWFAPQSWLDTFLHSGLLQSLLTLALAAGVILWAAWALLRRREPQAGKPAVRLFALSAVFFAVYLVFLLVTYLGITPVIDINQRILLPLYIAALWMAAALAGLTLQKVENKRAIEITLTILAVVACGWFASRSFRIVQQNYTDGLGYYAVSWQNSPTIQQVKALPADTPLVSNDPTAIYFLVGRPAYTLAELRQVSPSGAFTGYGDGNLTNDPAQQAFRQKGAALVLFTSVNDELQALYGDRAAERLEALVQGLDLAYTGTDGWIYYYPHYGDFPQSGAYPRAVYPPLGTMSR